MMQEKNILELERAALRGWPAAEVQDLDGWRLRAMGGVTRRANSVWTAEARGELPLAERIVAAERFYAARGLPAMFQVGQRSQPPELDGVLAQRGYVLDAPVAVEVAEVSDACARSLEPEGIVVASELSDAWLDVSARKGRYRGVEATYVGLLERLGKRARFALGSVAGEPAAVALGVVDGSWMSICSMLTLPAHRRRGLGRRLLSALARAARELDVTSLYLQVELGNVEARPLYASAGFWPVYTYHYRISPA